MLRCVICEWPLAESRDKGCVPGDCSYRPREGSPEWIRIQERRRDFECRRWMPTEANSGTLPSNQ